MCAINQLSNSWENLLSRRTFALPQTGGIIYGERDSATSLKKKYYE
jgi:hypothetical protein